MKFCLGLIRNDFIRGQGLRLHQNGLQAVKKASLEFLISQHDTHFTCVSLGDWEIQLRDSFLGIQSTKTERQIK